MLSQHRHGIAVGPGLRHGQPEMHAGRVPGELEALQDFGGGGLAAPHFLGFFPGENAGDAPVDPKREDFRHGR